MSTVVNVTAEHIAEGLPGDCGFCPVALAIAAVVPALAYLRVGYLDVTIRPRADGRLHEIDLPAEAVRFIRMLDTGQPVEPFTFELDYPTVSA